MPALSESNEEPRHEHFDTTDRAPDKLSPVEDSHDTPSNPSLFTVSASVRATEKTFHAVEEQVAGDSGV